MEKTILLLGMGSIMKSLIELLNHEKHKLLNNNFICVCPEEIPEKIYSMIPTLQHIKKYLTEENMETILNKIIKNNDVILCVDLTVNTDSSHIMKIMKKNGDIPYINTSIEEYEKDSLPDDIEKQTLYYQEIELKQKLKNYDSKTTMLHSFALNPGAVSSLVFNAIDIYVKDNHSNDKKILKLLKEKKFNLLCEKFVDMIHISEYDNQRINFKPKKNFFYSSWSAFGLLSEGKSPSFYAGDKAAKGYKPSKYNKFIYYSPKLKSMDCKTSSIGLDHEGKSFNFDGYMITHYEVVSLSKWLSVGDRYCPFISYVYSMPPISIEGLEKMKKNDYIEPKYKYVFNQQDIDDKNSYDSMGALVKFKDAIYWCGTILSNNDVIKILGKDCISNCTQLQVSAPVLAGIEYILNHKKQGLITSEDIPYKYIIERCRPYWGKYYCKKISN